MIQERNWGKKPNDIEVSQVLKEVANPSSDVRLIHIPSGFTDNVFRVEVDETETPRVFILKEYLKDWHTKEADIYSDILNHEPTLGAPRLIKRVGNLILLEYLDSEHYRGFSAADTPLLLEWIRQKQDTYRNNVPDKYRESLTRRKKYLITNPIRTIISMLSEAETPIDQNTIKYIVKLSEPLEQALVKLEDIPRTLEHGDLEPQNLLVQKDPNLKPQLRVLDWVNARADSGLFDVAQLLENLNLLQVGISENDALEVLRGNTTLKVFREQVKYVEALMNLNKLGFYLSKYKSREKDSQYTGVDLATVIKGYSERLLTKYHST